MQDKSICLTLLPFKFVSYHVHSWYLFLENNELDKKNGLSLSDSFHFWATSWTRGFSMFCPTAHTIVVNWISRERRWKRTKHPHSWAHFLCHSIPHIETHQKKYAYNDYPRIRKGNEQRYCYAYANWDYDPH